MDNLGGRSSSNPSLSFRINPSDSIYMAWETRAELYHYLVCSAAWHQPWSSSPSAFLTQGEGNKPETDVGMGLWEQVGKRQVGYSLGSTKPLSSPVLQTRNRHRNPRLIFSGIWQQNHCIVDSGFQQSRLL